MTIHFPQELIDEIIDHFSGDSEFLTACSLVCRAWVSRTRSCLFETCTLASYNLLGFCDLLQSPGCTFLQHVRSIDASYTCWEPADSVLWLNGFAAGLRRLPHVRALEMAFYIPREMVFCAGLLAILPHITLLTLRSGSPPAPFIDIISLCSALQELHILSLADTVAHPLARAIPPPRLHSLTFGVRSSPGILTWLNTAGHLPNVDSITLSALQPGEASTVRAALKQVGCALCHLEISVHDNSDVDAWTAYDFALHPNLRTLAILYRSFLSEESSHIRLMALITRLAAAGPALESLTIDFNANVFTFDWGALDVFLSVARFPRLRKVLIQCNSDEVRFVRSALPLLEASSVLHIYMY